MKKNKTLMAFFAISFFFIAPLGIVFGFFEIHPGLGFISMGVYLMFLIWIFTKDAFNEEE